MPLISFRLRPFLFSQNLEIGASIALVSDVTTHWNLYQTFDAGDHYIPIPAELPSFIPLSVSVYIRTFLGYWLTVIIGRYIGSLMGYRPFFREYTTDWELAQAKTGHTWFHRRNIETSYRHAKSWDELQRVHAWSDSNAANMGYNFESAEQSERLNGVNGFHKLH